MNRCLNCFCELPDDMSVCPHCGNVVSNMPRQPIDIMPGIMLAQRYIVGYSLGQGGFGIVYKAYDTRFDTIVAIKEFFIPRLTYRAPGTKNVIINKKNSEEFRYRKERFLAEARNMAKFGTHKSIPNVFEFFEENNTAYIVMELMKGCSLREYMISAGGPIDVGFAVMVANEVGHALSSMHDVGIIHLDVAPDNIFICSETEIKIKLYDLGSAKLPDAKEEAIDIIMKPGYSPCEQYDGISKTGPYTDIYALGATLYAMVTGVTPDESTNRKIKDEVMQPNQINPEVDENLNNAIMKAMAIEPNMRFQKVSEFLEAINGKKKIIPVEQEKKRKKTRRTVLAVIITLLVASVSAYSLLKYKNTKREAILEKATIDVWYCKDSDNEELAMQTIVNDFISKNDAVTINLKGFKPEDYLTELQKAADNNELPNLFESTKLTDDSKIFEQTIELDHVFESEQFATSRLLKQYDDYYDGFKKKMPLAFEAPIACVITNGKTSSEYSKLTFKSIDDFSADSIALDDKNKELIEKNIVGGQYNNYDTFMNCEVAVLLTSTMEINKIRVELYEYQKNFVYLSNATCNFIYEFSVADATTNQELASLKLLEWMLGNVYQNDLMISYNSQGELPLNDTTLDEKLNSAPYYEGLDSAILKSLKFEQ